VGPAARRPAQRDGAARFQPLGLALVAAGLAALVLAFPLHSLAALFASALLGGAGHGLAFLGAQNDINELAPIDRRGEVTAAFISCIYFGVATSAIGVGLLSTALSLRTAVTIFAAVVAATAVTAIGWHVRPRLRAAQAAR
jgi:predicted MFS family arabinose efflux permease